MRGALAVVGGMLLAVASVGACGSDADGNGTGGGAAAGGTGGSSGSGFALCAEASACWPTDSWIGMGVACSILALAGSGHGDDGSSDFVASRARIDCLIAAPDCAALEACVKASPSEAAACTPGDGTNRCSGSVLVECSSDVQETPDAFDCAAAGLVCAEGASDAECGISLCDPASTQAACDGDVLLECDSGAGVLQATDCRYHLSYSCSSEGCSPGYGGTCGPDDMGEMDCVGTGADCDEGTFPSSCDGTTALTCKEGKEARLDCRTLHPDFQCLLAPEENTPTCALGTDCNLLDTPEQCANGVVTFCYGGALTTLDCRAYGYSGCELVGQAARCVQ